MLFIPHGGGPLPLLGDPGYARLASALKAQGEELAGARAVIVVTAHWETAQPSLTSAARPGMLYDYYGFPEAAYRISYPAPGAPELAASVAGALGSAGFKPELDAIRGYDHGTFVPMLLMRPAADIPILQMSLLSSLDAEEHIAFGRALGELLDDDVVLIGSGFSFHNISALIGRLSPMEAREGPSLAAAFHHWMDETICGPGLDEDQRHRELVAWEEAPGARFCHPREEHLLPLHVCFGAAEAASLSATRFFAEPVKGYQTSGYVWRQG
ncbi:MAG: class III extradiol ring-cleavage dioxygenase [Minwuia sp.]|nr:class III extradiol ring-cleavage dioxygenase [Minwuia sp.]